MSAELSRSIDPRALRHDTILAGVLLLCAILSAALSSIAQMYGDEQAPLWSALVYSALICAPLAVRRRWPAPVAIVIAVLYFAAVSLRVPEIYVGNVAMFIALYTVGAWMANRRVATLVRMGIIVGMFAWLLIVMYRDAIDRASEEDVAAGELTPYLAFMLIQILLNVLYFGGAYYFGERAWTAARERRVLEQRTWDLEQERELTAAQAVALDRVRIARELHDVVAHHVSVMGVQAGAARTVIDANPDQARELLAGIEGSAREAIGELRQLLETLRTPEGDGEEGSSTLTLDDIEDLVASASAAGLPTTHTVVGDRVPVASLVAVNLYRITQESLTNARRHAGVGASADVRVRYSDDAVEVEIVNTGRLVRAARPGLGQLGMRERALASGGTIEIGPRDNGGWRVRARAPLSADPFAQPHRQTDAPAAAPTPAHAPASTR